MTQKKARHLFLELSRRVYLEHHGTLKGFGKAARYYRRNWHPIWYTAKVYGITSYADAWNSSTMAAIRQTVGM